MEDIAAEDFLLASYNYSLPECQIAQFPCGERGASRLMVLRRGSEFSLRHAMFSQLADFLPEGALLVANNSRVMPARLKGFRPNGGSAEFLLLTPLALIHADASSQGENQAVVDGLIKPAGKIRSMDTLQLGGSIAAQILEKGGFGQCRARLTWQGDLEAALGNTGSLPLPPYIKRQPEKEDASRYQTVYASKTGSVAAPTAGLHFTESMCSCLAARGHEWVELSLHVGYGTFSPVRCEDIRSHVMHSEYVELTASAAEAIARARAEKRPIVAVGTTSLRALEGIAQKQGKIAPYAGLINIFIYPGFQFKIANGLITNFHLPCSTLLMLVAALAGRKRILGAYAEAVATGYRFFSYGDAMLLV